MWSREKPILKPLNYVNTPPQQTLSHLFQCAKVINCCMGPQDPLDIWLIKTLLICDLLRLLLHGIKKIERHCNSMANFKTYWDSIQQTQYYRFPHNHYSLKRTLIPGTPGAGTASNENWLMMAIGFTFLMTGKAIAHGMVSSLMVSAAFVFPSNIFYVYITSMRNQWTDKKSLENSFWVTGWCKDLEITVVCLKHCRPQKDFTIRSAWNRAAGWH